MVEDWMLEACQGQILLFGAISGLSDKK